MTLMQQCVVLRWAASAIWQRYSMTSGRVLPKQKLSNAKKVNTARHGKGRGTSGTYLPSRCQCLHTCLASYDTE